MSKFRAPSGHTKAFRKWALTEARACLARALENPETDEAITEIGLASAYCEVARGTYPNLPSAINAIRALKKAA